MSAAPSAGMPRPTDRVALRIPCPEGSPQPHRVRWWFIVQPPPSVAFSLQGRIAAALGDAADRVVRMLFLTDALAEDVAAAEATLGEEEALRVLRRARSGHGIAEQQDSDGFSGCTERLWAVVRMATVRSRGTVDALALLGEPERERGRPTSRWARPSLLHQLLLHSGLRHDGEGPSPLAALPDHVPGDAPADLRARKALSDAVVDGSVSAFVAALDDVLASPDEMALLSAWALVHLWRPF